MADWFVLTLTILIAIALLIGSIYLLAYYSHPDDKHDVKAWIAKIVSVLGLTLAFGQVLLLPLDVSNNRQSGDGFNMKIFWYVTFIGSAVFIFILYPIITGIYETDDDWTCCQTVRHVLCCFIATLIVVAALTISLFFTIGEVNNINNNIIL